jgi:hypothetical protein
MIKLKDLLNEIKFDSNGQMKIKKQYNTVSDFEKDAKNGDYVWVGKNANDFKNIGQSYLSKVVGKDSEGNAILTPWKRNKKYTIPQKDQLVFVVESIKEASYSDTYFNTATDAVEFARNQAEKKGFEIDPQDWNSEITMGGRYSRTRPGVGKTNSFSVGLLKNGKPQRKNLNISLYGMESGKFELTYYIN